MRVPYYIRIIREIAYHAVPSSEVAFYDSQNMFCGK